MNEPKLRAYRACVNLPEAANGQSILIDESDPRWAERIKAGFLVPAGPPVGYIPPAVPVTRKTFRDTDSSMFTENITIVEQGEPDEADVLASKGVDPKPKAKGSESGTSQVGDSK